MLAALLTVLGALLVVLLVFGATPLVCEFRLSRDPGLRFRVRLSFLGGRTPAIVIVDSSRPRKSRDKPKKTTPKRDRARRRGRRITLGTITDLVWQVLAAIHIRHLSAKGRFGTGDPAETGQIYGLLTPLIYGFAPTAPRLEIDVTPVFDAPCLDGDLSGQVELVPFALLPPVARFGWRMVAA